MKNEVTTFDSELWNQMSMNLVQAMIGAISANFRQVSLNQIDQQWQLEFVLDKDLNIDREEIEDIGAEFEALQEGNINYKVIIYVSSDDLVFPEFPGRVLFRRRES